MKLWSACFVSILAAAFLSACNRPPAESTTASAEVRPVAEMTSQPASNLPKPNVNGSHVMQYVKQVVAFGPRPPGSTAHLKLEEFILSKLKGVDVEQDRFTAQTPVGKFPIN